MSNQEARIDGVRSHLDNESAKLRRQNPGVEVYYRG
jgi:hypothetical protein